MSATNFYQDLFGVVGCDFTNSFQIQPLDLTGATSVVAFAGIGSFTETLTISSAGNQPITQFDLLITASNLSLINATTGAALGGTAAVLNGSTSVTFSQAQTLPAGACLLFSSQPIVFYFIAAPITNATSCTLSTAYTGVTNAATSASTISPITPPTCALTPNSPIVPTSSSAVGLVALADSLMFSTQPNIVYQVAAVNTGEIVLASSYTGPSAAAAYAIDVETARAESGTYPYQRTVTFAGGQRLPYGSGMLYLAPNPG